MLAIAREKAGEDTMDILYLLQDMREFELYGTMRAAVSVCDSMNYILEEEDLLQVKQLEKILGRFGIRSFSDPVPDGRAAA